MAEDTTTTTPNTATTHCGLEGDISNPDIPDFTFSDITLADIEGVTLPSSGNRRTLSELTEAIPDGKGVFDVLMRSIGVHIQEEYTKNRIRGPEYSQVYLQGIQTAMQSAIQFMVEQENVALIAAQVAKANADVKRANIEVQKTLIEAQILQYEQVKVKSEIQNLDAQTCNLRAQFDLTKEQICKAKAETALLEQRKLTEQAQLDGSGIQANSVMGHQNNLLHEQTEGFKRNAEQKAAAILADMVAVEVGTNANYNATRVITSAEIASVFTKLRRGVDISTADETAENDHNAVP